MKIYCAERTGMLIIPPQSFDSYNEIDNLLRYITRTKVSGNKRKDVIKIGGRAVQLSHGIETAIRQFKQVQSVYDNGFDRYSRHCFHEIFAFNPELSRFLSDQLVTEMAEEMSRFYWIKGFQVVYAVHKPDRENYNLHIHFAVNAISVKTGKKWHTDYNDTKYREREFQKMVTRLFNQNFAEDCDNGN